MKINNNSIWVTSWNELSNLVYTQYRYNNYPIYIYLANNHLQATWVNSDAPTLRMEINKIKVKHEQYISKLDILRIITDNKWEGYGRQQHKAINVPVRELSENIAEICEC